MSDEQNASSEDLKELVNETFVDEDDESMVKAITQLLDQLQEKELIELFTDLSNNEIRDIAVLSAYDDDVTQTFLDEFKALKVSKRRRGRKELVQISKSLGLMDEEQKESRLEKIIGGLR